MADWDLVYTRIRDPRLSLTETEDTAVPLNIGEWRGEQALEAAQKFGYQKWMALQPNAHAQWERWQKDLRERAPRLRFGVATPHPRLRDPDGYESLLRL